MIGLGWDSHRLEPGRRLVLGGVEIPGEFGLAGHSDADVLTHAIMDAVLGASGAGDIGEHFPDTDPRYRDADSLELLRGVVNELAERGMSVEHVDSTVLIERPRLAGHKGAMRQQLARALGVPAARVNVKASTGEGMGFVGRGEGVAALAVVRLMRIPG